jgi:hypothetical protein
VMTNVELNWHIVCGSVEIGQLELRNAIRPLGRDDRYDLFLTIKYPNTEFYRGTWGPEILYFEDQGPYLGPVGRIHCTYDRYKEIAQWFLSELRL